MVQRIISLISFHVFFHFLEEVLIKNAGLAHIHSSIALHTYLICSLLIYSASITSFLFDANDLLSDFGSKNDSSENQDKYGSMYLSSSNTWKNISKDLHLVLIYGKKTLNFNDYIRFFRAETKKK